MGKAALFALGLLAVTEAYQRRDQLGFALVADGRAAEEQGEVLARAAAVAGFEQARHQLSTNFATGRLQGDLSGANYSGTVTVNGLLSEVMVVGRYANGNGSVSQFRIAGTLKKESPPPEAAVAVPTFMQNGIMTEDDLRFNGNVLIKGYRRTTADPVLNANVHTNGSLSISGGATSIFGSGSYVTTVSASPRLFRPQLTDGLRSTLTKAERVNIPFGAFAPSAIADVYGPTRVTEGSETLSGEIDFRQTINGVQYGTPERPFVWHIKGNAHVPGTATFTGNVIFAVEGSLNLGSSARVSALTGPLQNTLAWYVGGPIHLSGNGELWGQFMTQSSISLTGTPSIYGNLVARRLQMSGTPNIYYVPPSPALTRSTKVPRVQLRQIAYAEEFLRES